MEENSKVMEAAFNFTDAVLENKRYFIEKSNYLERAYWINVEYKGAKTGIALYDVKDNLFIFRLPIRDDHQQKLKAECVMFDKELEAAELREKELKEEFETWRKNNGK